MPTLNNRPSEGDNKIQKQDQEQLQKLAGALEALSKALPASGTLEPSDVNFSNVITTLVSSQEALKRQPTLSKALQARMTEAGLTVAAMSGPITITEQLRKSLQASIKLLRGPDATEEASVAAEQALNQINTKLSALQKVVADAEQRKEKLDKTTRESISAVVADIRGLPPEVQKQLKVDIAALESLNTEAEGLTWDEAQKRLTELSNGEAPRSGLLGQSNELRRQLERKFLNTDIGKSMIDFYVRITGSTEAEARAALLDILASFIATTLAPNASILPAFVTKNKKISALLQLAQGERFRQALGEHDNSFSVTPEVESNWVAADRAWLRKTQEVNRQNSANPSSNIQPPAMPTLANAKDRNTLNAYLTSIGMGTAAPGTPEDKAKKEKEEKDKLAATDTIGGIPFPAGQNFVELREGDRFKQKVTVDDKEVTFEKKPSGEITYQLKDDPQVLTLKKSDGSGGMQNVNKLRFKKNGTDASFLQLVIQENEKGPNLGPVIEHIGQDASQTPRKKTLLFTSDESFELAD